jgi:hypothetical protein
MSTQAMNIVRKMLKLFVPSQRCAAGNIQKEVSARTP